MHPLEEKFLAAVREHHLLTAGTTVIVALSGGADSTALTLLLARCRTLLQIRPVAVHVNHGLRPAQETAAEETAVTDLCRELDIPLEIHRPRVARVVQALGRGVEDAARRCRYGVLRRQARRHHAAAIAVAHTGDDQAEALLLRLVRGSGRAGLTGMAWQGPGILVRPLLHCRRAELESYLRHHRVPWCDDPSNRDPRFLRSRIRHHLLPLLEREYNPNIRATICRTAAILATEEAYLDQQTAAAASRLLHHHPDGLRLDAAGLHALHPALARRVTARALIAAGHHPDFTSVEAVRRLAAAPTGKRLHLRRGLRIKKEKDAIHLSRPQGRCRRRGDLLPPDDPPNDSSLYEGDESW